MNATSSTQTRGFVRLAIVALLSAVATLGTAMILLARRQRSSRVDARTAMTSLGARMTSRMPLASSPFYPHVTSEEYRELADELRPMLVTPDEVRWGIEEFSRWVNSDRNPFNRSSFAPLPPPKPPLAAPTYEIVEKGGKVEGELLDLSPLDLPPLTEDE